MFSECFYSKMLYCFKVDGNYPRKSFREGLWNHRRTFVSPAVCLFVCLFVTMITK